MREVFRAYQLRPSPDVPVTLRFPFRFPKKKKKFPDQRRKRNNKSPFQLPFSRCFNSRVAHAKKNNTTHTHTHAFQPANTCSTHQSPIPDPNPKSRVRLLSHSQIMMDDNFPQQSLRVPASFSRARQPGPGRTPLLSVPPPDLPPLLRLPLSLSSERGRTSHVSRPAGTGRTSPARVPHCESEAPLNPSNLPVVRMRGGEVDLGLFIPTHHHRRHVNPTE